MATVSAPSDLPAEIRDWLGRVVIVDEGEIPVQEEQIASFLAAVEDENPLYRDTAEAQKLGKGRIAPPALLSTFTQPTASLSGQAAGAATVNRPLELHFRLKDSFGLPRAVVIGAEITYYEPVRPGDQVRAEQVLDEVEGPCVTRLGKGRKWTLSVHYRRQDGVLLGVERLRFFAYGAEVVQ